MRVNRLALVKELFLNNCIMFGEFVLSSGKKSSFYIDLRIVPSIPELYCKVINTYIQYIKANNIVFDKICGIATAGLPIASVISYNLSKPLIYVRKETKDYGRKKIIEGYYERGDRILLIDDVATTGKSLVNAINILREEGCIVSDALVFVDREQGASLELSQLGVKLHAILKVSEILSALLHEKAITKEQYSKAISELGSEFEPAL
ncbi:MAG: orotate phosphoribosyltransferase [Thermoprotei archaeon]|nr:MAG: orotate phosphoribosyltransferase [Thermoprotei archaeon]RLF09028.1 MAG: orotate phosphoribosyltransferase [Thermoprotei archaeon]